MNERRDLHEKILVRSAAFGQLSPGARQQSQQPKPAQVEKF
jgi:hypothetical protein